MKNHRIFYIFSMTLILFTLIFSSCGSSSFREIDEISSPNDLLELEFFLDQNGSPYYLVEYKDQVIIDTSALGIDLKHQEDLLLNFEVVNIKKESIDEIWEMPWGEQREVINKFNGIVFQLKEKIEPFRKLNLHFKLYNDGLGFRYEIDSQESIDSIIIMDEKTEFTLIGDHDTWWIPGDWDIYEHLYQKSKLSEIDALSKRNHPNLAQTYIPNNAVNTPVTMKTAENLYLSFHEANLTNYPCMTLAVGKDDLVLRSELVGSDRFGYKAKVSLPFNTPWRSIQVAENAGDLVESKLILNLNEPNKLGDIPWFEPMKYVGIWWEMHLGLSSWNLSSGIHGATTKNTKKYIDFAAKNNIKGVLVEGWNMGWDNWFSEDDREGVFDFVTPCPDYDLEELVAYAKERGVQIIMHHETNSAPRTYDRQLDTAYTLMNELGIHAVKTGYVGKIVPEGEYHHGQWMVNHYRRVIEKGAEFQVAVNAHEPIKATGIRRTYPNAISREGLRGQEFNAWAIEGGNPPDHIANVVFTRMLAGPIDFTPGAFEMTLANKEENQINTTLAHQLALYVVLYSPIQMACDLPQHYEGQRAFQFIRDVGVNWEQTKVLDGEIGDFVVIAREERDSKNWFIGAVTDETDRMIDLEFNFLEPGTKYNAILYRDGERASYKKNRTDIAIDTLLIDHTNKLKVYLAEGGGMAMSLIKSE